MWIDVQEDDIVPSDLSAEDAITNVSYDGCVYFLSLFDPTRPEHDFELIKVGVTRNDVFTRIAQLQTGNPYQIRLEALFQSPVAWQVENWVHCNHRQRVVRLEWLRMARGEIASLVEAAKNANARLTDIAHAHSRWSTRESNDVEREPSEAERRLHKAAQRVHEDLVPVEIRLESTMARLAILAGSVSGIPGVVRVRTVPPTLRFVAGKALEAFPELAISCLVDAVRGGFHWRGVATRRTPAFRQLRKEAEDLTKGLLRLNTEMLGDPSWCTCEGERTDEIARAHDEYLALKQQETRLRLERNEIRAEVVRALEDCKAIAGMCSFGRSRKQVLDSDAFRASHPLKIPECSTLVARQVRRTIYRSRAY